MIHCATLHAHSEIFHLSLNDFFVPLFFGKFAQLERINNKFVINSRALSLTHSLPMVWCFCLTSFNVVVCALFQRLNNSTSLLSLWTCPCYAESVRWCKNIVIKSNLFRLFSMKWIAKCFLLFLQVFKVSGKIEKISKKNHTNFNQQ